MPDQNEIGKAKITVEADVSGFKSSIDDAKNQTQKLGDEADATSNRGKKMFRGLGEGADNFAAKIGKATGIIGAMSAATVALGAAWKAVVDYIRDGAELAGEFLSQFDSVTDAEGSLEAIGKRLVEVNAELERLEAKPFTLFGRSRKQIEEEIAALRDAQLSISRQVRAQRKREAQEAAAAFKEEAAAVADEITNSFLPSDIQIQRQAGKQREAIVQAAKEANVALGDENVQRALKAIDQRAAVEIEAIRKADEERRKLEQEERARRIENARAEADAYAERLRDNLESLTSAEFITTLESIPKALREVSSGVRRLK